MPTPFQFSIGSIIACVGAWVIYDSIGKRLLPSNMNIIDIISGSSKNLDDDKDLYPAMTVEETEEVFNLVSDKVTEGRKKKKDPKKGTGKKPKGSGRRLYTDEDPKNTIGIKFSTRQDIVDTLNKTSFKNKPHARQSQVINLIHQRVRAALGRTKDPLKKAKLKSAFEYIKKRKEASKKKTQRLKKTL